MDDNQAGRGAGPLPDTPTTRAAGRRKRAPTGAGSPAVTDYERGREMGQFAAQIGNLETWKMQTDLRLDRIDARFDGVDARFDEIAGHLTRQDGDNAQTRHLTQQILDGRAAAEARRERWAGVVITTAIGGVTTYAVQQALAFVAAPHALQSGGPLGVLVVTGLAALVALRR